MQTKKNLKAINTCLMLGLILGISGCRWLSSSTNEEITFNIGPKIKMRFVAVPALKLHVGKYEVSNRQYRSFKPDHNSGKHKNFDLNQDDQPAVNVSWKDANKFCEWLTKEFGGMQWRFRLPTEKEWETYAACGRAVAYPWGDGRIPRSHNYYGRENPEVGHKTEPNDGYCASCPVQKSGMNPWGLFGVGGNVWEWCSDPDDGGKTRVIKGASWADAMPMLLEIAYRNSYSPDYKSTTVGFRVVAEKIEAGLSEATAKKPATEQEQAKEPAKPAEETPSSAE